MLHSLLLPHSKTFEFVFVGMYLYLHYILYNKKGKKKWMGLEKMYLKTNIAHKLIVTKRVSSSFLSNIPFYSSLQFSVFRSYQIHRATNKLIFNCHVLHKFVSHIGCVYKRFRPIYSIIYCYFHLKKFIILKLLQNDVLITTETHIWIMFITHKLMR